MDQYGETPIGGYEHPLTDHDGGADDFDWMATLAAAGIPSVERDLSHMATQDMIALLVTEEKAAVDLARMVGLPQEWDAFDRPIAVELSDEAQALLVETVNAVPISGDHFAAQMQMIDLIPEAMKVGGRVMAGSSIERADMLGLGDPGAPLALLARTIALRRWRAEHDPAGELDHRTLIDAAARAPILMIEGQPAFDGPGLRELVEFIVALPW